VSAAQPLAPLASAEVAVKLFADDKAVVQPQELIAVFHRWIKENVLEDELMIDVANYAHVPKGPGIILVCDKAHYSFDVRDDRWGLRYRSRREARATGQDAITRAFASALNAASLLVNDPTLDGRYAFRTDEVEFGIYDRLRAPSGEETLEAIRPALDATVEMLYGEPAESIELVSGPKEPFMVSVKHSASPSVDQLLHRLAAAPAG
jgi:hypothetical protein